MGTQQDHHRGSQLTFLPAQMRFYVVCALMLGLAVLTVTAETKLSKEELLDMVGKKFVDTSEKISEEGVITRANLPANTRVVQPGQMVTADFRRDRLNVHLDDEGKVKMALFG